jgi:hypothetical protein
MRAVYQSEIGPPRRAALCRLVLWSEANSTKACPDSDLEARGLIRLNVAQIGDQLVVVAPSGAESEVVAKLERLVHVIAPAATEEEAKHSRAVSGPHKIDANVGGVQFAQLGDHGIQIRDVLPCLRMG